MDPLGGIAEPDESDQLSAPVPIHVDDVERGKLRLSLLHLTSDSPVFEVSFDASVATRQPLGVSALVDADWNDTVVDSELTAWVCGPAFVDPVMDDCVPLQVRDNLTGTFGPRLVVPPLAPDDRVTIRTGLAFGPPLAPHFDAGLQAVAESCIAGIPACVTGWQVDQACAEACLGPTPPLDVAHADFRG